MTARKPEDEKISEAQKIWDLGSLLAKDFGYLAVAFPIVAILSAFPPFGLMLVPIFMILCLIWYIVFLFLLCKSALFLVKCILFGAISFLQWIFSDETNPSEGVTLKGNRHSPRPDRVFDFSEKAKASDRAAEPEEPPQEAVDDPALLDESPSTGDPITATNVDFQIPCALEDFLGFLILSGGSISLVGVVGLTTGSELLPQFIVLDALILFACSSAIYLMTRSTGTIDMNDRKVTLTWTNPFFSTRRVLDFDEIACIAVRGKLQGFPFLLNWFSTAFTLVMVTKSGDVLPFSTFSEKGGTDIDGALARIEERAKNFALVMDVPYLPRRDFSQALPPILADGKEPFEFQGVAAEKGPQVLQDLRTSSLLLECPHPEQVRVEISTTFEKFFLGGLSLFFLVSTVWLLMEEWGLIAANPRIMYLVLLDSTSFLVTILWVWKYLVDEHYILDLRTRTVDFQSRILFFRRRWKVADFEQVVAIHLVEEPWAPFRILPDMIADLFSQLTGFQYYVAIYLKNGREIRLTETVHGNLDIPRIWAKALNAWITPGTKVWTNI